jgi:hypothetical protein
MGLAKAQLLPFHDATGLLLLFAACLFLNFPLGAGAYTSQIFLCVLLAIWIYRNFSSVDVFRPLSLLLVLLAVVIWELAITGGGNHRLAPELGKIIVLLFSCLALVDLFPREKTTLFLWAVPLLVAVQTLAVYLAGTWDYYDPFLHRFGVPALGSPNTTAFVLAFCLLLLQHCWKHHREAVNRWLILGTLAVLSIALLGTQSRGGLLIYLVGLFLTSGRKLRIVLLSAAGVGVAIFLFTSVGETVSRLNLIMDVREGGGTGRFFIWQQLAQDSLHHPIWLIVGRGPGSIEMETEGSYSVVVSSHSMIVEIIYSYGLIGAAAFVWILTRLWRRINDDGAEASVLSLKRTLLLTLVVCFFFDSYPLAAQILWFSPFLLAITAIPQGHGVSGLGSSATFRPQKRTA